MKNKDKIKVLENQIGKLENELSTLNSSVGNQKTIIESHKKTIKNLKSKVNKNRSGEFLSTYIPLIIAVVSLVVAWKALTNDKEVALASGVFKKSDSSMTLANLFLKKGEIYNLEFGYSEDTDEIVFHELPLELLNRGEITDPEMSVSFKYFKDHNLCLDTFFIISNSSPFVNLTREYHSNDKFEFSTYNIEKLNPSTNLKLREVIHLKNTEIVVPFDSLNFKLEYQYKFDLILTGKDKSPEIYTFNVAKKNEADVQNLIELKKKYLHKKYYNKSDKVNKDVVTIFITPTVVEKAKIQEVNSTLSITRIDNEEDVKIMIFNSSNMKYRIHKTSGEIIEEGEIKKSI